MNTQTQETPGGAALEHDLQAARAHLVEGRLLKARRACRSILDRAPEHVEALLLMAQCCLGRGRASEATEFLTKAGAVAPEDPDVRFALAEHHARQNDFAAAATQYQGVVDHRPDDVAALSGLAMSLQMTGHGDRALAAYTHALDLAPHDDRLQHNFGTLLKERHDFDGAVEAYRKAITLAPYNEGYRLRLGLALIEKGEYAEAVEHMDVLALQNPLHGRCAYYQSYAYMKLGNGAKAVDAANRFMEIRGPGITTFSSLASTSLTAGDSAKALEACESALQHDAGNRQALSDYAIALTGSGRTDEAGQIFDFDRFVTSQTLEAPDGYDSIGDFNRALDAHIRGHDGLNFDRFSLSCHEGKTSSELFVEPLGPAGTLRDILWAACKRYRDALGYDAGHPYLANLAPSIDGMELSAWATVLRNQGYQHGHIHARAWISGVYYVTLPSEVKAGDQGDAGHIEFGRAPHYYPDGAAQGPIRTIRPEEGRLLFFPSYFFHRTIPFASSEDRVTIAFDFGLPSPA